MAEVDLFVAVASSVEFHSRLGILAKSGKRSVGYIYIYMTDSNRHQRPAGINYHIKSPRYRMLSRSGVGVSRISSMMNAPKLRLSAPGRMHACCRGRFHRFLPRPPGRSRPDRLDLLHPRPSRRAPGARWAELGVGHRSRPMGLVRLCPTNLKINQHQCMDSYAGPLECLSFFWGDH